MRRSLAGVSVPLGLWKPSPATVNRSAGRKLTLAGGRAPPLPATAERRGTGAKSASSVPNTSASNVRVGVCGLHFFLKTPAFNRSERRNEAKK